MAGQQLENLNFMPMNELVLECLPSPLRDENLFQFLVLSMIFTAKITVSPQLSRVSRVGVGYLLDDRLRLIELESSDTHYRDKLIIITSRHLISDEDEARNAEVSFYNLFGDKDFLIKPTISEVRDSTDPDLCLLVCNFTKVELIENLRQNQSKLALTEAKIPKDVKMLMTSYCFLYSYPEENILKISGGECKVTEASERSKRQQNSEISLMESRMNICPIACAWNTVLLWDLEASVPQSSRASMKLPLTAMSAQDGYTRIMITPMAGAFYVQNVVTSFF